MYLDAFIWKLNFNINPIQNIKHLVHDCIYFYKRHCLFVEKKSTFDFEWASGNLAYARPQCQARDVRASFPTQPRKYISLNVLLLIPPLSSHNDSFIE